MGSTENACHDLEKQLDERASSLQTQLDGVKQIRKYLAHLPKKLPLPINAVRLNAYKAEAKLVFVMKERSQVAELLEALPCVPGMVVRTQKDVLQIPAQAFVKDSSTRVTPVAGLFFEVWGHGGGYTDEKFVWWTLLDDALFQVVVPLHRTSVGTLITCETEKQPHVERGQRPTIARWKFDGVPNGECLEIAEAGQDDPGRLCIFWPDQESMKRNLLSMNTVFQVPSKK